MRTVQRSALCRSRRELFLQNLASIHLRTSPVKFAGSPRAQIPQVDLVVDALLDAVAVVTRAARGWESD